MRAARASIVVGVLVGVLSASAAWAYTGTTAGKKLAAQMLSSYKHVHYLAGSEHGGVYYCTSGTLEGFSLGAVASLPSNCRAKPVKATVSWVATLSDGNGASAVGSVVAHGHPTIDWVANRGGTFYEPAGSHCWVTGTAVDSTFVGSAPFGFFPAESMALGGHHGSDVQLIGTMGHGNFKEVDTIDSHTHHIVGENINFAIKDRQQAWNLTTSYREPSKGPKAPTTKPAC